MSETLKNNARNALNCLYIAVQEDVANDVSKKVYAFTDHLESENALLLSMLERMETALEEISDHDDGASFVRSWQQTTADDALAEYREWKESKK